MLIKNFKKLASSKLREDALNIIDAGLSSLDTKKNVSQNVFLRSHYLFVKDKSYDLNHYRKIFLVAIGKNAFDSAKEIGSLLGSKLTAGIVLCQTNGSISRMKVYQCDHPDPSEKNVKATRQVIQFLEKTTVDDLVLVVVSGGGSAMLTAPYKITAKKMAAIADSLMRSGADIEELNIVRKHLSQVKGGRLAAFAYPSTVIALFFSDVVGNDLSAIASGPTVLDLSTIEDAQKILRKYEILKKLRIKHLELTESPKEGKFFQRIHHYLLLDNKVPLNAMEKKAKELGYKTRILSDRVHGYARETGKFLLSKARPGEVLLAAGETTVRVLGSGEGGRNQEMVLANLQQIKVNQVFVTVGTDGHDHSDFAGAIGDSSTLENSKKLRLSIKDYLAENNSFHFFKKIGDGIETGKLESNVADLMVILTKGKV